MAENNSGGKWKILIGPAITLALVLGGFVGQYATTRAEMADFKEDLTKLESKVETAEDKIHDLELKTAVDSNTLQDMKQDLSEIKTDVKKLLGE